MKEDINKIGNCGAQVASDPNGQHEIRITVTDVTSCEVLYDKISKAGVACTLEDMKMNIHPEAKDGEVEGRHQFVLWGNPIGFMHAFQKLAEGIRNRKTMRSVVRAIKDLGVDV